MKYVILSTYGKLAIPLGAMAHLEDMKIISSKGYGKEREIREVSDPMEFEVIDGGAIRPPEIEEGEKPA